MIKDGATIHHELVNITRGLRTPFRVELRRAAMRQIAERVARLTGKAERLAVDGYCSSWSPDGRQMLYTRNDESAVEVFDLDRKETRTLIPRRICSPMPAPPTP